MDRRIEEYLAYLDAVRGLSPRTLRSYREDFSRFEAFVKASGLHGAEAKGFSGDKEKASGLHGAEAKSFGGDKEKASGLHEVAASEGAAVDIDATSANDIRAFAAALVVEGKAGSSVNRALSALRGYFRYRVRFGGMALDPSRDVEGLPSRRPLPRFLFEDEAAAFMALPEGEGFGPSRDRAMLEFLYSTGCRVAEAANLTLDRLDLAGGSARVMGKGSKERIVFLAGPARAALGSYLPLRSERRRRSGALVGGAISAPTGKEYLFVNARGGRLTERGIEWIIQGYAERSGSSRSVTPHAFRHSFATHLVGRGADIRAVQELLGHSSISTTQVYAHVDMERLRKVYEQSHPHGGSHGGRK